MEVTLIRNFPLAMIAIVNPLGKVAVWVQASEGCDASVRMRLAMLVTGTATLLLLLFLFFGQAILDFLGLDVPAFRVGGGIIILLIGIDMLRGHVVDVDTTKSTAGKDALSSPHRDRKFCVSARGRARNARGGQRLAANPSNVEVVVSGSL